MKAPSFLKKNMKYLSITFLLFCMSCSWNNATTTTGYGQPTMIHSIKHTELGDDFNIKTIAILLENVEFNISDHRYQTTEYKFNSISAGTKYHFLETFSFYFVDIGAGFKLTEFDEKNKWLADSHLLADISFSIGIIKEFKKFSIKLSYMFQHLSVPWRHDKGLNYDVIQFGISIPFF